MDDFLKQLYPEGEERWIKVKYINSDKAIKTLRFNSQNFSNEELGFEVMSIGINSEHMPQIEALIELKAEIGFNYEFMGCKDLIESYIDRKIEQLLEKVLINKQNG